MTTSQKLDSIVLPEIEFNATPMHEAIAHLSEQARRSDDGAKDPTQAGLSIGYLLPDPVADALSVTASFHDCELGGALGAIAGRLGLALDVNGSGAFVGPQVTVGSFALLEPRYVPGTPEHAARERARQASAARALELCPEINDATSPHGAEYARLFEHYQTRADPIMQNDNLPYLLARQAAANAEAALEHDSQP